MGKIKTKLIKRTSERIVGEGINFKEDFETNKRILSREMPSKKVRNQIAGYVTRIKKIEKRKQEELEKGIKSIKKE